MYSQRSSRYCQGHQERHSNNPIEIKKYFLLSLFYIYLVNLKHFWRVGSECPNNVKPNDFLSLGENNELKTLYDDSSITNDIFVKTFPSV